MYSQCPNCAASGMEVFFEAPGIPVHSCMMLGDRRSARSFPTRDLALGLCRHCGFISNVLFDPSVQEYTTGYEEQQSFSPRFRKFQTELIAELINRYDVRGKDVVEIGCGKGDFLIELCETGGNRGIGIDPACDAGRMSDRAGDRVNFIAELYSTCHADLPCDVLCCRHTLEHIHPTAEFVANIRNIVGNRPETLVLIEVPDAERVLRERAFWDIYYEHCSYFTLGSLARVFRANRFDVVELRKDYDDQYLLLVARSSSTATRPTFDVEDDLQSIVHDVADFREHIRPAIDGWRTRIGRLRDSGKKLALWGSGSKCVSFLSTVGIAEQVEAVVDINPYRHGKYLAGSGVQVESPESLCGRGVEAILVMNPIYCAEIRRQIESLGVEAELIPA